MARKLFRYNELSIENCKVCGKKLKLNLVTRKQNADLCYSCFRIANAPMQTARDIRNHPEWRSEMRKHLPLRSPNL